MIMPSRWFAGGKGLDSFRESMLYDKRISNITDFVNAKDCFPKASIGGGVNYILWDKFHNGDCKITTIQNGTRDVVVRSLSQFAVFIRYNQAVHILNKMQSDKSFSILVNSRNPFGLSSNTRGSDVGKVKLVSSDGISYIPLTHELESNPLTDTYKILLSKVTSEHAGEPDKQGKFKILSRTEIIGPYTVCTDSYLILAANHSKEYVCNSYKYICTKFARFLLMLAVSSINLSQEKFQFVPMQDFTEGSDIDWSKSVAEIDRQLYSKYGLTEEEIAFIESMIKPM